MSADPDPTVRLDPALVTPFPNGYRRPRLRRLRHEPGPSLPRSGSA
jgi:hypothetical protein